MGGGKQTREYKKIQDNYATLSSTLTDHVSPGDLGNKLFEAHLIGVDLRRAANYELTAVAVRINKLLAAVHNQIELNSENFHKFIKILEDYKQLEHLMKLLELKPRVQTDEVVEMQQEEIAQRLKALHAKKGGSAATGGGESGGNGDDPPSYIS